VKCRPWGLFGGLAGFGNSVAIHRYGEPEQNFDSGKAFDLVLQAGDAYILRSGGGGGFGSPLDRDPEKVAHDLRQGYITRASAESHYGIVFRDNTSDPDIVATQALRENMRAEGLPVDEPEAPEKIGESHSHAHHHHHQDLTEEERLVIAMSGRCCA
jgi:N-methylhydantoinase B